MDITIIEGPAGAGKTSLLRTMMQSEPLAKKASLKAQSRSVRAYPGKEGLTTVVARDLIYIVGALLKSEGQPVFVDRLLLSSYVYATIRGENPGLTEARFLQSFRAWLTAAANLRLFLESAGYSVPEPPLYLNFIILIPEAEELLRRRATVHDRTFPYRAGNELFWYRSICTWLGCLEHPTTLRIPGLTASFRVRQ